MNIRKKVWIQILFSLIMIFTLTGCGSNSAQVKKMAKGENTPFSVDELPERSTAPRQTENEAKGEEEKEREDLKLINIVENALCSAVADAKATGHGMITIGADVPTLSYASSTGTDAQKVHDAMVETMGDTEVKLNSGVGSGQNLICYYDTSNNVVVTYVAQHDDSVGGSEISPYSGVVAQNCKYNNNTPLMASNI